MFRHVSVDDWIYGRIREGHYTKRHTHIPQIMIEATFAQVAKGYQQMIDQIRRPAYNEYDDH